MPQPKPKHSFWPNCAGWWRSMTPPFTITTMAPTRWTLCSQSLLRHANSSKNTPPEGTRTVPKTMKSEV